MLSVAFLGLAFVTSHFILSMAEIREPLVKRLGESGFLGLYSVVAAVLIVLLVIAYSEADRHAYVWYPDPLHYQIAMAVMWVAVVFVIGSFMAPNPSSVGMGEKAKEGPRGMLRVTRHPLLLGFGLWALAHVLANGDVVSVAFFLTFAVLAFVGAWVLDRKKAYQLGEDWHNYTSQTSLIPFGAILSGRTQLVVGELMAPVVAGTALYIAIFWGHEWLSGVEILLP